MGSSVAFRAVTLSPERRDEGSGVVEAVLPRPRFFVTPLLQNDMEGAQGRHCAARSGAQFDYQLSPGGLQPATIIHHRGRSWPWVPGQPGARRDDARREVGNPLTALLGAADLQQGGDYRRASVGRRQSKPSLPPADLARNGDPDGI